MNSVKILQNLPPPCPHLELICSIKFTKHPYYVHFSMTHPPRGDLGSSRARPPVLLLSFGVFQS